METSTEAVFLRWCTDQDQDSLATVRVDVPTAGSVGTDIA